MRIPFVGEKLSLIREGPKGECNLILMQIQMAPHPLLPSYPKIAPYVQPFSWLWCGLNNPDMFNKLYPVLTDPDQMGWVLPLYPVRFGKKLYQSYTPDFAARHPGYIP